ncbi:MULTISPECIES: ABC transporter ATP-binding protein [Corynebacterium]|uniref:ABC transporter ATP-binding protein n=1 Tax=Corynebacterium TaxID=1716 RepID=UPI0008A230FF|nr:MULTISPECIES: ABC transporter ATP-binding protein [Corynebacterium]MDK6493467.1 ABC transporter ATP-binding protein [Corynebacterium coyleae]MDK8241164.1 ABC transporter ATP-binding protein [Corynebacterium coyleae]MDK8664389.1 ABC transporter ATP-binding protein [Corynebacterium coyleae]MDK8707390.1 ABC transporter ATP-binding protein [Corynebacterium coyleae]MDK8734238.1 ABC transporter ATP-binding protein [Corynebacterium coyleae]
MAVQVDDLTVKYGRSTILDSMSFGPLTEGNVIGLLGPNAAGKSTLIKTLAGIKTPTSGTCTITLDGATVSDANRPHVVGYVPQDLLTGASLTAFESIVIAARRGGGSTENPVEATARIMSRLGITALADRMMSAMSGGQRQLVGIAQMLVREPRILLLDEPTSALDLRHQVDVLQLVREVIAGTDKLAIVAIHDLNLAARYCDELLVMKGGKTITHDSPNDAFTPELLEQVYGIRAKVLHDGNVPVICPV